MAGGTKQITLAGHLGMTQIGSIVQKKLLGGYEVPVMQFLTSGMWLFLKGVVFGRARRNSLEVVAKMFVGLSLQLLSLSARKVCRFRVLSFMTPMASAFLLPVMTTSRFPRVTAV